MKRGKKVVLLSMYDYAGSGYRITEAINLYTNHFVEYVVLLPVPSFSHFKRYPSIFLYNEKGVLMGSSDSISRLHIIFDDCDIIHIKSDFPAEHHYFQKVITNDKPIIQTVAGSTFRALSKDLVKKYKENTVFRTALNPDLNYPEYDGIYVPFVYDCENAEYKWKKRDIPVISHSPSNRSVKGTDLFERVCDKLAEKYEFKVNIIEKLAYIDCLDEKSNSTIFFDQMGVGSYGNSAVEAMAMGIPTVAYISDKAYNQSNGRLDNCPVVNCGQTFDSVYNTFEKLLTDDLTELSERTKKWCDNEHGYEQNAKMWGDIYCQYAQ